MFFFFFFFQAEDGIRDVERSRGLGDVYKRQYQRRVHGISKKAEFAKKEISKIDPILLEKYKEAVGSYAKMLELLKKQRQLLEEDKKKVKCELEELHLQFFKSLKEGATEEEINRICGMPGDQNDLEDVSIHEEDEEPHAAKVTENQPYHLSLIHI
eukprot:TRINITY_DN15422_c0_g1_i5.p2 TRINITY_DN15422_c0_g1~~TRINITY_DN15422_c0_g1_i5.p2  ORF type:complete len:156 (+),score=63.65 TRINITY_DN15422_c0_g1_i5:81-548(+)